MEPIKSGKNSSRWSKSIRGGQNLPEGVILIGSGQNPSEVVKIYQRGSNLIGGGYESIKNVFSSFVARSIPSLLVQGPGCKMTYDQCTLVQCDRCTRTRLSTCFFLPLWSLMAHSIPYLLILGPWWQNVFILVRSGPRTRLLTWFYVNALYPK